MQGLAIYKRIADRCFLDLRSVERAYEERLKAQTTSTELVVGVGIVTALMGFLLGKGIK